MNYFIDCLCASLLLLVVFQDFRERRISWILIPLLGSVFAFQSISQNSLNHTSHNFIFNLSFIAFQLGVLTIYISVKNRALTNILDKYIGIGDILFFLVVCLAFSPLNFIIFFTGSILFTLIAFIIYNIVFKKPVKDIPLAGAMSLALLGCFIVKYTISGFSFYQDIIIYLS